ncbi:plasmid SOS inhibition protein A [Pantoea allii]|uniref:Plasmid SOS inhibition protein A n=1 Tax=Pantoea allii TaxID=574096 RepID=A0ABS6VJH9_9GAMM|nr:plasmid SOS inhibition protein A [Pantoea allii]MBW1215789.1 plasmid SOS inhibition protein A [Pantoea allii]MBW1254641.1 plasmid SOS inhibition protein A [Pantoea allii]MBW1259468.1 plasmid SOS inhibition protein A [Pantoea allii]MBW1263699.1 plasmid SOS inhibition protein A [Pantoea allii]MBW1268486.1 plasmid SOS inhibition protein A [Pantoea allii]
MIPKNRSLVPLCEARRAMLQAVEYVECRRERQTLRADFPYAQAFFRFLKGSKRITLRELRFFDPVLREEELRGRKREWLRAVDWLIESGGCATHPLPSDAARLLFPEVIFQCGERRHRKAEMRDEKYSRQFRRREALKARAVQALTAQAEIELAFQTPATVASWASKWSDTEVSESELVSQFYRWADRFPSMAGFRSEEAGEAVRVLERWMVPNKLTQVRGGA